MPGRAELYLDRITQLAGGKEPAFHMVESTHPGRKAITALCLADTPEPGLMSGFTYGLSTEHDPSWRFGRPELAITIESDDIGWPIAIAILAERFRGECPFSFGNTFEIGEPITAETRMTAFVLFGPAFPIAREEQSIDVGDALPIILVGCYPIYSNEKDFITRRGLKDFWDLDRDIFDVGRGPVVFD